MKKTFPHLLSIIALLPLLAYAKEYTGTLKAIQENNSISIGYRESSIPFSYLDEKQKPVGYAMDLCLKVVDDIKKILNRPHLDIQLIPVTSQTRIPLLLNKTIDIECGSTTNTIERQKQVSFSNTYYVSEVKILTHADANIKGLADLKDKTVVTTIGTTSDRYIKHYMQSHHLNTTYLYGKDHAESFFMLESGRADAFVLDDVLLAGLRANSRTPQDYKIVGEAISLEPYAIMFRKNDEDFKRAVNGTLEKLMRNGQAAKIYDKWFMHAIPPKGSNLRLPMNHSLTELFIHPSDQGV